MSISMHPSIAKRITVLEGLRERARQAKADFYQKPGVMSPPSAPLFIVKPIGNNAFEVVERATGRVVTTRTGINTAVSHSHELEVKAHQFNVKQFGKHLSSWTLRIGITLTLFAFLGSHA